MDRNMKTPALPPLHIQIDIRAPYDREYRETVEQMVRAMIVEAAGCGCGCDQNVCGGVSRCAGPENAVRLCDTDAAIRKHRSENVPVIAVSHEGNASEELMGTPWLILSPVALTADFLHEIYCRHHGLPLIVTGTSRCLLRELTMEDYPALLKLQQENAGNPEGCFFPDRNAEWKDFLANYIAHQYPFYGFGLYAILEKSTDTFIGIAGFAQIIEEKPDRSLRAEVSYSLLRQFQHRGYAEEVLRALIAHGQKEGGFRRFVARIHPENTASLALARKCGVEVEYI